MSRKAAARVDVAEFIRVPELTPEVAAEVIATGDVESLDGLLDVDLATKTQAFFTQLAAEMRKPHFGEHAKQFTSALLIRAEEAGIYTRPNE